MDLEEFKKFVELEKENERFKTRNRKLNKENKKLKAILKSKNKNQK